MAHASLVLRRRTIALLIGGAVVAVACRSGRSSSGAAPSQAGDGEPALYGVASSRGIVLIAGDRRTSEWSTFAAELGRLGYRVLVVPLPEGDAGAAAMAGAEVLARQGVERVVFVGSGAGTAAALAGARAGAAGVAILNPPAGDGVVSDAAFPGVASLLMASLADGPSSATAQQLYRSAPEPRRLALYPAKDTAPSAFAAAGELRTAFLDFLQAAFQPLAA